MQLPIRDQVNGVSIDATIDQLMGDLNRPVKIDLTTEIVVLGIQALNAQGDTAVWKTSPGLDTFGAAPKKSAKLEAAAA